MISSTSLLSNGHFRTENKHLKSDDGKDDDDRPSAYPEKDPVKIVGDFLSGVKKDVMSRLEKVYTKSLFREFEIELVVTVPAVWSDTGKAKDLTRQAVFKAGFDSDSIKLSMIAEPEAAAIYTLKSMEDGAFSDIKVNQQFNTFGEGNK
jgi:molecular chaperone DnaK (HSP70)